MASLVSDRGGAQGSACAHAAAPNLLLAVRRIAGLLGLRRVAAVGPMRLELGAQLAVVDSERVDAAIEEASRDGLAIVSGRVPWAGLDGARAVVAVDPEPAGSALDALAEIEASAKAAGWCVAHAGLLHTAGVDGLSIRRECPLVIACKPHDSQLAEALANGPLSLALDPAAASASATDRTRAARVLIASYEVAGPTGNGGIGTAYHSLAHVLADAGHDVTLLFTGWIDPGRAQDEAEWRRGFAESGIDFAFLGTPWDLPVRSPHHAVRRAYELHRWLADAHAAKPFDVVHIPECIGHGAFALTAKALGFAYADVEFVVGTHSSTRWVAECNREPIEQIDMLVTEHLERLSVERADVVLSPTAYLVDYMRDRGWALPERTFVQPLARPRSVRRGTPEQECDAATDRARTELVFFGRLETRKGLEAFCDAVDVLTAGGDCPFDRVTFLGRPERVMGEDASAFVARRAASWDVAWEILPDLGHDEAIAYLRMHPCVVAIPSLVDNSPNTVIEAVALGVPFVASRSGGTAELIAADDLAASTFDGWRASTALEPPTFTARETPFDARSLAVALRERAASSANVTAAVDDAACDRAYDSWHRAVAGRRDAGGGSQPQAQPAMTAAVCVVAACADDVRRIAGALATGTQAPAHVIAICAEPPARAIPGVDVTVADGRAAGAARARLIAGLDADVVIVLRHHEDPDPELVERVCHAMAAGDAGVLTLVCRDSATERDTGLPPHLRRPDASPDLRAFVPVGGPALAAVAYPALSVGPYAIRSTALAEIGGYAGDAWGEACDRELLARAALSGLRIEVLPDPLATTRCDDRWSSMRARYWGDSAILAPEGEELARILRPFRERIGEQLADLPGLVVGGLRAAGSAAAERMEHAEQRQEIADVYEGRIAEFQELVALYEERIEEQRGRIARYERGRGLALRRRAGRVVRRLHRATRGLVRRWPRGGVRFTRWRLERLRRRIR